ncbi:hypothetical protein TBLA_0C03660 [Henningerozyma blattae CBS 6284]|uniref:CSC1/OSCA1-like 7TM region domain-containing protein n=1 Tax=Henningerozyma blattae (strain ATCC 34711 / CBS 6284 / DSM 70876 / NBRC 10599 / NRRL Y-10934 / UCD 77-7) TaxID=1071380 RepID=I2H1B7_HENB6|nr:hypothetical protein TBLA_0C03660 [Tetrapisispora blattae CBS 6284]CCH60169.1 hypothetical protein TBLA_0C03660 [Tetrapisispora blattae CBS 6284]
MSNNVKYPSTMDLHSSNNILGSLDIDDNISILVVNFNNSGEIDRARLLKYVSLNFLSRYSNTPRTGSAHKHLGISLKTFLISILISFVYFVFQFLVFICIRIKYKEMYQIHNLLRGFVEDGKSQSPRDITIFKRFQKKFFDWIKPLLKSNIEEYIETCGLDTYLFFRFLKQLTIFFLCLSFVHLPILLPIHYFSNKEEAKKLDFTTGNPKSLDKFNMSNISNTQSQILLIHLILSITVVIGYHVWLIAEMQFIHSNLQQEKYLGKYQNTLYIDNIPEHLHGNKNEIIKYFSCILPNSVESISFFPKSCPQVKILHENINKIDHSLQAHAIDMYLYKFFKNIESLNGPFTKKQKLSVLKNKLKFFLTTISKRFCFTISIEWINLNYCGSFYIPLLKFQKVSFQSKSLQIFRYQLEKYYKLREIWEEMCVNYKSYPLFASFSNGRRGNNVVSYKKIIISFKSAFQSHMFAQILQSRNINEWNNILVGPNPKDIIWENMNREDTKRGIAQSAFVNVIYIIIILGWILPVACVGLLTQIEYQSILDPFLSSIKIPSGALGDLVSNLLSIITLIFLIEIVPFIFNWLAYFKSWKTKAEVQIDTQRWFFYFLFVHLFMVVTISSGIYFVIEKIINNPTIIATLLAHELPKSSNFFCSFIVIRCLAYAGGTLLQTKDILLEIFYYRIFVHSPQRKFKRMQSFITISWGSAYALFSVFGCIGIIYSVLAPVILPLCFFSFACIFYSVKYLFEFQNNKENVSETYGKLYIQAMLHLYTGVYCMEVCMIGIFALSNHGKMSSVMILIFILTLMANYKIYELYVCKIKHPPLCSFKHIYDATNGDTTNLNFGLIQDLQDLKYNKFEVPFMQKRSPLKLWMVYDTHNCYKDDIRYFKSNFEVESKTQYYAINNTGNIVFNIDTPEE